jgi:hypothetical protein
MLMLLATPTQCGTNLEKSNYLFSKIKNKTLANTNLQGFIKKVA